MKTAWLAAALALLAVVLVPQASARKDTSRRVEVVERERFKSPWLQAAMAVARRDFRGAATIFGAGGFKAYEAFFRLNTGEEQDVRAALDFYRGVDATRYIREGEAMLSVSA